ncbi:MAG: protein-disulfide reductase DsbD family protein [Parvibaculum sp.]
MNRPLFSLFCAAVLLAAPAAMGAAGAEGVTRLSLVAAETAHDGAPLLAGIDMGLAKGWKTYWREPGDSGIAPSFDWSRSENVADVEVRWPVPQRFDEPGDITFGYRDEVIWPLRVVPANPALPVTLRLDMFYGVCSVSVCIPREAELALALPAVAPEEGIAATQDAARLRAALARVPVEPADPGLLSAGWREADAPTLEVRLRNCGAGCVPPSLIVDGPPNVWFGTPQVSRQGDTVLYTVPAEVLSTAMLDGEELSFILSGPGTALKIRKTLGTER